MAHSALARRGPASVATVVLAASGVTLLGIGAEFWALALGLVLRRLLAPRAPRSVAPGNAKGPAVTAGPERGA